MSSELKYYCDRCGSEMNWTGYAVEIRFETVWTYNRFGYCKGCLPEVREFVKSFSESKRKKKMVEKEVIECAQ